MAQDPFKHLWNLGYRRLVPIIPPTAQISPNSNYSKNPGARGKAVGVKGPEGWFGYNWTTSDPTEADLKKWFAIGAGVGIKAGPTDPAREDSEWLIFIDSDTHDVDLARTVDKKVFEHFGELPCRIGKQPKALYLIRVSGPVRYMRVGFGGLDPAAKQPRPKHCVEILAGMKQAVMPPSIHPGTGQPYHWARNIVPLAQLPIVTPERLRAFMDDLKAALPDPVSSAASIATTAADRAKIDQDGLRGDPKLVERAVRAIPNTTALFPTYDDMTRIGIAIHGALPDDPDLGLELFTEWCGKWDGEGFDPRLCEKYWNSYQPPHSLGADFLFRKASELAPQAFNLAEVWFEEISDPPAIPKSENSEMLFGIDTSQRQPARRLEFISAAEAAARALEARAKALVAGLLDCGAMSVVYGAPGVGKSFVMLDLAYHIATGRPWAGRKTTQGAVAYIAAEGGGGIFARVKALTDRYGVHTEDGFPAPFALLPTRVNLRDPRADIGPLLEALDALRKRFGPLSLIVVDTLARAMGGGDENSPVDMGQLVEQLDKIREATGAHVAVVHHTGKDAARGMRGHSCLLGAIDTEIEVADGVIRSDKQRDNESGVSLGYKLRGVSIGLNDDGEPVSTAVVDVKAGSDDRQEGGAARATKLEAQIMEALEAAWRERPERHFIDTEELRGRLSLMGVEKKTDAIRIALGRMRARGMIVSKSRGTWAKPSL